jgi:hypothetical protein
MSKCYTGIAKKNQLIYHVFVCVRKVAALQLKSASGRPGGVQPLLLLPQLHPLHQPNQLPPLRLSSALIGQLCSCPVL